MIMLPFLNEIVAAGCSTLVLQTTRLEQAMAMVMGTKLIIVPPDVRQDLAKGGMHKHKMDGCMGEVASHMQCVCATLRNIMREDLGLASKRGDFPKYCWLEECNVSFPLVSHLTTLQQV